MKDVAFAWKFTTGSQTRDMVTIRRGLYGYGPMGYLANRFPAEFNGLNSFKIAYTGSRKTGFNNIDFETFKCLSNSDFFISGHGGARTLLAITQSGIKYNEFIFHENSIHEMFSTLLLKLKKGVDYY
jgi:hypothetical protein